MKKLLFLSLILALVSVSCSKDEPQYPIYQIIGEDERIFYEYNLKDTAGIDLHRLKYLGIKSDVAGFLSTRYNNQIWVGIYNVNTKEEIQTWIGDNPIENSNIDSFWGVRWDSTNTGYAISAKLNNLTGLFLLNAEKKNIINCNFTTGHKEIRFYNDKIWILSSENVSLWEKDITDNILISSSTGEFIASSISILEWEDKIFLGGFTADDRIHISAYTSENQLLADFYGNEKIERNLKIHMGYGEYLDYYITSLFGKRYRDNSIILETEWGYAIQPLYVYNEDQIFVSELLILNNGQIHRKKMNKEVALHNWYNGSVFVRIKNYDDKVFGYYVYTREGDSIIEMQQKEWLNLYYIDFSACYPISYESFLNYDKIYLNLTISRYTLEDGCYEPIWQTRVKEVSSNAKVTWNLIGHTGTLVTYQVEITEYDGTKETLNFTIDTETGEVNYL